MEQHYQKSQAKLNNLIKEDTVNIGEENFDDQTCEKNIRDY